MKLDKRSETLLRRVIEDNLVLPGVGKTLQKLWDCGFVFVRMSTDACFGDKSVTVISSLAGEDYILDIDSSEELNFANKWGW
jgi:hypothetical protein